MSIQVAVAPISGRQMMTHQTLKALVRTIVFRGLEQLFLKTELQFKLVTLEVIRLHQVPIYQMTHLPN
jgi:hypothetical protein